MGFNYAQAKAAAAAADAADEAAVEAVILVAKSRNASTSSGEENDFGSFQNSTTDGITARYQRLVTNDDDAMKSTTPVARLAYRADTPHHRVHSDNFGSRPSLDEEEAWTCRHCNHFHSSFKFRCVGSTRYNVSRNCDSSASFDDNSAVMSENNEMEEKDDSSSSSSCPEEIISWDCSKCQHNETKSTSRCSNCKGWRGGKRPKKSRSESNQVERPKQTPPTFDSDSDEEHEFTMSQDKSSKNKTPYSTAVQSKKNLKPLFEINDRVYGPWWPDNNRNSDPSWYAGVITNYITVQPGRYGPVRHYDVMYDDDGEEVTGIEDHYVFSREDYILTTLGKKEWVGVVNVLDDKAKDSWAEIVGWYDATIDGETYSFSRLVNALRAYDAHVLKKKGKTVKLSELNQPNEILRAELGEEITNSSSNLNEITDYSLNYIGVSWHRQSKKYEAFMYYQKESSIGRKRSLGLYILAADAALSRDVCSDQLGIIDSPSNFSKQAEYEKARAKELEERGITVDSEEVMSYLNGRVRSVVSAVAEIENDDLSEASSDKEFDVADDLDNSDKSTHQRGRSPSSGFSGVSYLKQSGKYVAYIYHNKAYNVASNFILAADAAYARDECLKKLGISYKPHFADKSEYIAKRKKEMEERNLDVSMKQVLTRVKAKVNKVVSRIAQDSKASSSPPDDESNKRYSSIYIGVSYNKSKGKYIAYMPSNYKQYNLGFYVLAADGAYARDSCLRELDESFTLNFANISEYNDARRKELHEKGLAVSKQEVESYMESKVNSALSELQNGHDAQLVTARSPTEDQDTNIPEELPAPKQTSPPKRECTSQYSGVSLDKLRGCYVSRLMHEGTNFNLGSFELSVDAALMYDVCAKVLKGKGYERINFATHSQYTGARSQEMSEKGIMISEEKVLEAITAKRKCLRSKIANSNKSKENSRTDNEVATDSEKTNHEVQHSAQVSLDNSTEINGTKPRNTIEQALTASQSHSSKQTTALSEYTNLPTIPRVSASGLSAKVQAPTILHTPKQPSQTQDLPKIPRVGLLASIAAKVKVGKHNLDETAKAATNKKTKRMPSPTNSEMHFGGDDSLTFNPPSPNISKETDIHNNSILETNNQIPIKSDPEGMSVKRIKTEDTHKFAPPSPAKSILQNKSESPAKISLLSKPTPLPPGLDVSKLILLTADQCQAAPFPVGTRVWWELDDTLNEGQVNAVYFDTTARDLRYTVNSKLSDHLFMTANDLSYAPSTSVFVSPGLWETGSQSSHDMFSKGASLLNGSVLLSKKDVNSNGDIVWIYNVTIEHARGIRIIENVPSCNVTRRP